nr:GNAT family N-acetyltransferase [Sphingomonas faeni]
MDDWNRHLTTRTGFRLHVRPARPADAGTVAEFFTHVTREDLRFRFLAGLTVVGDSQIAALTQVDHRQTEDFLAFTEDGSTMIATAMLACDAAMARGEVAIAIHKDFKNKGLGWTLLDHIARYAEAKGIKTLQSIESRDNHTAIAVERDMGFSVVSDPGDPSTVIVTRNLTSAAGPDQVIPSWA